MCVQIYIYVDKIRINARACVYVCVRASVVLNNAKQVTLSHAHTRRNLSLRDPVKWPPVGLVDDAEVIASGYVYFTIPGEQLGHLIVSTLLLLFPASTVMCMQETDCTANLSVDSVK